VQQARFLLSSDTEFTKVKRLVHGLDWKQTFFEYKALLWNDQKPSVRDLLQDLNNKIFGQEQPSTRRRSSFSPIAAPNPEFVSLAAALDEEDEPTAEASVPQNLRSRDLTTQSSNTDDVEDDEFDIDLDGIRSTAAAAALAPAPSG
jgi:hypothetical protein